MDINREHPVSTSEAENFWAEGQDAIRSATGENNSQPDTNNTTQDSAGIDMPGVGVVRPAEASLLCAGRESGGDEVFERSRKLVAAVDEQRECLLLRLLFAARDLAQQQIEPARGVDPAFCTDCLVDLPAAHEAVCRTGRVLQVVAELVATVDSKTNEKEAGATDGEKPAAGDGIRPRGNDRQAIARELLGALYTMIGIFGMPPGKEPADEVHAALVGAEVNGVIL